MSNSFNNWSNIANELIPACEEAVTTTAQAGAKHVQEQITANNQVITGFMRDSVYASTPQGSDYTGGDKALPEEKPTSNTEAIVGVAANYSVFNEMGTVHMPPKPFFSPGLDVTQSDFDTALETLAKRLEDAGK